MELNELAPALERFMSEHSNKLQDLYEQLCDLQKVVYDDLIGGATKAYKAQQRGMGISSLKDKYHDKFDPYGEDYKRIFDTDPSDIYERLYDLISGENEDHTPAFGSDEEKEAEILRVLDEFKSKFGDKSPAVSVVEVSKEEPKVEEAKEPEPEESLEDKIRKTARMNKGRPLAISPED